MPDQESKSTKRAVVLNMRIDPKVKFLADMAARDEARTLSAFVEEAIKLSLRRKAEYENREPRVDEPTGPQPSQYPSGPLWGEKLFATHEAERFFHLATNRYDLLSDAEQKLWTLFAIHNRRCKLKDFQAFWNSPSIDTKHLQEGDE